MQNITLAAIFFTGLFTGGLTCLAVQGGLLATTIAQREEEKLKDKVKDGENALPILSFVTAKLVAYTLLGLLLGWFGSLFTLSLAVKIFMQFAVGLFMIGTALAILDVHPFFRYFIIQPPRFLTKYIRNKSKGKSIFAPAILGAFTVFIPCGTTQAMMALAIAAANPLAGMAIMFAFILGTSPVFFILGYFAARLGDIWHKKFMKLAAYAIILLALFNINNTIALTGSQYTFGGVIHNSFCIIAYCEGSDQGTASTADLSEATITIGSNAYTPDAISVKAGSPVTLHLVNSGGRNCIQAFTIPKLGIQKIVPLGTSDTIQFTAPSELGQLAFMCSMGMYRGVINVN